jgi:hypothetical protein
MSREATASQAVISYALILTRSRAKGLQGEFVLAAGRSSSQLPLIFINPQVGASSLVTGRTFGPFM